MKEKARKYFKNIEKIYDIDIEMENNLYKIKYISGLCNNGNIVSLKLTDFGVILNYGIGEIENFRIKQKHIEGQNIKLYNCFITKPEEFKHEVSLLVKEILKK